MALGPYRAGDVCVGRELQDWKSTPSDAENSAGDSGFPQRAEAIWVPKYSRGCSCEWGLL
jgi:hypothetical protein